MDKAERLNEETCIRQGFEENIFFVKSSSSSNPHLIKSLSNAGYACDNQCLGFKSRKVCAHTIAVAAHNNNLHAFLQWYKTQNKKDNLTALTTFAVNKNAGAKKATNRSRRDKSPDVLKSVNHSATSSRTLGEKLTTQDSRHDAAEYTAEASENPLHITIRKSRPTKPSVVPTTSTPFELIEVSGRIKKCAAGCNRAIKDGPDNFTKGEIDEKYCVRHKEHDFVWIESQQQWKKTFDNKHYHVYANCIKGRNPHFVSSAMLMHIQHTLGQKELKEISGRLNATT